MNGKRGLGGIMSALLAAMSFVGQASAYTKKKTKKPDHAAAVLRDRKNRGRDKGGNERGEELELLSAESGVVGLIKEHPKISAGLGLVGLSAIGYGGYKGYKLWYNSKWKGYKLWYNSKWNEYYRKAFSEENYADYYGNVDGLSYGLSYSGGKICLVTRNLVVSEVDLDGFTFLCGFDGTEKSLLLANARVLFLWNCFSEIYKELMRFVSKMSMVSKWDDKKFESFEDIEEKFCGEFSDYSQKIKEIVKFYSDFAGKYLGRLADKLLEYGEKENKKLVVGEGGAIKCVARST